MIKLREVTQQDVDDLDARLKRQVETLGATALEIKAERDKYAAVLHRVLRTCQGAQSVSRHARPSIIYAIEEMVREALE